jgi:hypothetical protein
MGIYNEFDNLKPTTDKSDVLIMHRAFSCTLKTLIEVQEATKELVLSQGRMLDKWADGDDNVKSALWKDLHEKGDACRDVLAKYNVLP